MTKLRKTVAAVSAVAVLGAGGLSAAQAATTTTTKASTSARPGPKRGGGPMMSTAQLAAIAKTLGVTSDQLKAALDATKPAKGDRPDHGDMAAELATALGVDVAKVKTILDANRPAKPADSTRPAPGTKPPAGTRPMGAKPDNSKLITALATGLGIDEATVKAAFDKIDAAHKADRDARDTAKYAAIATKLGVSADAVKAAFEANRPAKPGPPPAP